MIYYVCGKTIGGGGGGGGMCVQFQHVFILKFQLFFSSSLFYSYDKL